MIEVKLSWITFTTDGGVGIERALAEGFEESKVGDKDSFLSLCLSFGYSYWLLLDKVKHNCSEPS